jgi:hypothetical protein
MGPRVDSSHEPLRAIPLVKFRPRCALSSEVDTVADAESPDRRPGERGTQFVLGRVSR